MRRGLLILLLATVLAGLMLPAVAHPASTYVWSGGAAGDWQAAASWAPLRAAPAADDILQFSSGGTVTATNLPDEECGQLLVTNGTAVTLEAGNIRIVTIYGDAGTDLEVAPGSSLNLGGNKAIKIFLESGATCSIAGSMTLAGAPHRLDARDAGAILFAVGATMTQAPLCTGSVFDISTTEDAVIFAAGSTFVSQAGANPFKLGQPASKVVFQSGSLYRHEQGASPSFSGRSYGHFELNVAGVVNGGAGSGPCSMGNLTITSGTLNTVVAGPLTVREDIAVAAGGALNFNPATPAILTLGGTVPQSVSGSGTLTFAAEQTVVIGNPAGVTLVRDISLTDLTISAGSSLTAPAGTLAVAGNFTNSGTFLHNGGTVHLTGDDQAIAGSAMFHNLTKIGAGAAVLTLPAGETQTVAGTLTLQGVAGGLLSLRSSTSGTQWRVDPQGGRSLAYLDVQDAMNVNPLSMDAAGSGSVDAGNNWNWRFIFPPAAPVALAADAVTQTGFTVRWNPSAGAVGYRLDVAEDAAFTTLLGGYGDLDVGPVTAHTVTGVTGGREYHFRVRAYNGGGIGASSNSAGVTTLLAPSLTSPAGTTLTFGSAGSFTVTATGNPVPTLATGGALPGGITFTDNGNGTATIAGTAQAAGAFLLTVTVANGVGSAAVQAFTLTIDKASQTIVFHPLATAPVGSPDFDPGATASSGLPVAYSSDNLSVATIVGNRVHVTGIGAAVITATQEGDGNRKPASAGRTLTVAASADLPAVILSTLSDGAVTTAPILNVSGMTASPNGIGSVAINGTEVRLDAEGDFSAILQLVSGNNDFSVDVTDTAGLQTVITRSVVLDATAPGLTVSAPPDGSVTSDTGVTVAGTVADPGSTVACSVNSGASLAADRDGASFSCFAGLVAGMNTIEVMATAADGRVSRVKRTVRSIPAALFLAVTDPPVDSRTGRISYAMEGTVSGDPVSVSIVDHANGKSYAASVENGIFRQQLELAAGRSHPVTVTAVARSGGSVTVTRNLLQARLGAVAGGDVVSLVDAVVALKIAIGILDPTAEQLSRGDVAPVVEGVAVGDGRVDVEDVLVILRMALGLSI